jgi:hypothetical protein
MHAGELGLERALLGSRFGINRFDSVGINEVRGNKEHPVAGDV